MRWSTYRRTARLAASLDEDAPTPSAPGIREPGKRAPRHEKLFVQGMRSLVEDEPEVALALLDEARRLAQGDAVSPAFLAAYCATRAGQHELAMECLEEVVQSETEMPDYLQEKYLEGVSMTLGTVFHVGVQPEGAEVGVLEVEIPFSRAGAACLLAQDYFESDRDDEAEALLLDCLDEPLALLTLSERYDLRERWDDLLRLTDGLIDDDQETALLLIFRGHALAAQGLADGAVRCFREAASIADRGTSLHLLALYERGRVQEAIGKGGMARRDFEAVYSVDSSFPGVRVKLGLE